MITIPVSTDVHFSQVTALSGRDFIFTFAWNAREGAWYFDLADQDGVLIATSRKIVVDWPLITRCADARRPVGTLWALDTTGAGIDPGRDDFGTRVQLIYVEPGDETL